MGVNGYPRPIGGFADPDGFRLWIRFSPEESHALRFTKDQLRLTRRPRKKTPLSRLTEGANLVALYLLAVALFTFFTGEKKVIASMVTMGPTYFFIAVGMFQHMGATSWHALEHKSLHVLKAYYEGQVGRDYGSLRRALEEAPSVHPRCGSGIFIWMAILLTFLTPFLPANAALALAVLVSYLLFDRGIALGLVLPFQNAFLAQPTREQLDATARHLAQYLEEAERLTSGVAVGQSAG